MKILLRAFNVNIKDEDDKLSAWKTKSMLKQKITSDFALFQMFRIYNDFGVQDTSVWGDLSFEDVEELLTSMANSQDISSTFVTAVDSAIRTITVATPTE